MAVLTVIFLVYFLFMVILLAGWKKAMTVAAPNVPPKEFMISVVVPVRNEEFNIGSLLNDLSRQEYRNFEVIVVNDDSEDETLWAVSQSQLKNIHVIHSKGKGKKAAITAGVRAARGPVVVTTDADCSLSEDWLKQIRNQFMDQEVMMAFGGVRMSGTDSFFNMLQKMEFASLIGSGAATAAMGMPTMCNGANMAFRKKVFSEVKGYDGNINVPSGDDEFLMHKIHKRYPDGIRFMGSPDAVVTTTVQPDRHAFINQRVRWASKWRYNTSRFSQAVAVLVILFQVAFIANWFLIFTTFILQSLFYIAIKIILEAAFLLQVCRFLRIRWKWLTFFSLQVIYPFYVIGIGVASFFRPFEWKHRIFKP